MAIPDVLPFADLVDIDWSYKTPLVRLDGSVAHIAVSNARRPSYQPGTKAHGYIRKDGTIVQDVSLRMQSGACRQGNPRLWTWETEGGLSDGDRDDGEWTPAQLASLARIARFAHEHGVPLRLMESSRSTERGLGWHRLGIDGNFPASPSILAGRGQRGGGELWSKSKGKTCPMDGRVQQMPTVLDLALSITPTPAPTPPEDDMYKDDLELQARIAQQIAWQDNWFRALEAQAEANRNLLAGWTRDRTREAVTASTAAVLAAMPNVDLTPERINALVGDAVDKALEGKSIPVAGRIEIDVPTLQLGQQG